MPRWSPWRAARDTPNLSIRLDRLPVETGGAAIATAGDQVFVFLDRRLTRAERKAALAHELVHLERGTTGKCRFVHGPLSAGVFREENRVDRIVALRLVPLDELAVFVDRLGDLGHGVGPIEAAEEFDVPARVAAVALGDLATVRARQATSGQVRRRAS